MSAGLALVFAVKAVKSFLDRNKCPYIRLDLAPFVVPTVLADPKYVEKMEELGCWDKLLDELAVPCFSRLQCVSDFISNLQTMLPEYKGLVCSLFSISTPLKGLCKLLSTLKGAYSRPLSPELEGFIGLICAVGARPLSERIEALDKVLDSLDKGTQTTGTASEELSIMRRYVGEYLDCWLDSLLKSKQTANVCRAGTGALKRRLEDRLRELMDSNPKKVLEYDAGAVLACDDPSMFRLSFIEEVLLGLLRDLLRPKL